MTNKVKPFFIRITDDMTPQMVQDAFDKCVDAGAIAAEGCRNVKSKHEYEREYNPLSYDFFGIDDDYMTYMDVDLDSFTKAQEITIDQLDEWLGLEVEQEWNGEGLPPVGVECEKIFDGKSQIITPLYYDDHKSGMVMFYYLDSGKTIGSDFDWCLVENCIFRKPETPEQKAERERIEAIKTIQRDMAFSGSDYHAAKRLYEKGYRKQ